MPLNINNNSVSAVNFNNNSCKAVFYNGVNVFNANNNYFYFEALSAGRWALFGATAGGSGGGGGFEGSYEISTDGGVTWTSSGLVFDINNAQVGDRVYFRGVSGNKGVNSGWNGAKAFFDHYLDMNQVDYKVGGDITTLINPQGNVATLDSNNCNFYAFCNMFQDCTHLIDSSELVFPTTTLDRPGIFYKMFLGCANMVKGPGILSATTLSTYCYGNMFQSCPSLLKPPILPATTLEKNCYDAMFDGDYALAYAPELPCTGYLPDKCYYYMFSNCTSMAGKITIPATNNGGTDCLKSMLYNCRSLSEIEIAFTWFGNSDNWVYAVNNTGTFYCPTALGTNETIERGNYACPVGWTVVNTD